MSFTSSVTLNTKDPFIIELLGNPSQVMHNVTGKLHLHVQRTVTLKSASVAFIGEVYVVLLPMYVKADPEPLAKITFGIPEATGVFEPGTYDFPFTLALPGNLITTDRQKLQAVELFWNYSIQTTISPGSLFMRRKISKYPVTLLRKQIYPSDNTPVRFCAKREGEFDVTVMVPRMVGISDTRATVLVHLHPHLLTHCVRDIQVKAIQIEKVEYDENKRVAAFVGNTAKGARASLKDPSILSRSLVADPSMPYARREGRVHSTRLKDVSSLVTVKNPDQQEFTEQWGREYPVEVDVEFLSDANLSPAEDSPFHKISHAFQLTVNFANEQIRPLSVNAPFVVGDILEVLPGNENHHGDGMAGPSSQPPPPGYGDADDTIAVLDANTGRVAQSMLTSQAYPEREPIVPDVDDIPPPTYDYSEYSQGQSSSSSQAKGQERDSEA
ncbi:hypothetical protein BGW42_008427 [Actinomortierella wolfii]|nr:hypothetical protein BGW42_008427 [Actinomortierella wolfii]